MNLFGDEDVIYDDEDQNNDSDFFSESEPIVFDENPFPSEKLNPTCIGHEEQEKLFLELFEKNAMPHAMIFSGLQGIGKTTMAFILARFLFKHGKNNDTQDALFGEIEIKPEIMSLAIDPKDPIFSRIASGGHADLLHISRDIDSTSGKVSASLKVESLRKIEPFLHKTSSEGGWRIVLIEDADTMNNAAQNAILKILEEPPKKVLIILITHRIGKLIPTIRSRSRLISFKPLSSENISQLLSKKITGLSVLQLKALSEISGGSIGHALRYIEDAELDTLTQILSLFDKFPHWDWKAIHELSNNLATPTQDKSYKMFCEIMQWIFRQMLFLKARAVNSMPDYLLSAALENILRQSSLQKLTGICDDLKILFERTDYANLDRREAIRASFLVVSQ